MFRGAGEKGFTLIEILFVIVVLGILAAVVIPRLTNTSNEARVSANASNKAFINTQVERYYFTVGSFPSTNLSEMVPAATYDYFPEGLPACPFNDGAYTLSATTNRITGHNH